MRTEILMLVLSVALGLIHILSAAQAATKQRGIKWNLSSRESEMPPLSGLAGRLDRALQNFKETFPLFIAAVVVVIATDRYGTVSEIGSVLYLVARTAYLPVYAMGIKVIRSLLWLASVIGIVLVVSQVFIQ